eukprot:403353318
MINDTTQPIRELTDVTSNYYNQAMKCDKENDRRRNERSEPIFVKYESEPDHKHILFAIKDLQKVKRIKYQAIGRATSTLKIFKERFDKYDIGDIEICRHFFDPCNLKYNQTQLSFYLIANKSPDLYHKKYLSMLSLCDYMDRDKREQADITHEAPSRFLALQETRKQNQDELSQARCKLDDYPNHNLCYEKAHLSDRNLRLLIETENKQDVEMKFSEVYNQLLKTDTLNELKQNSSSAFDETQTPFQLDSIQNTCDDDMNSTDGKDEMNMDCDLIKSEYFSSCLKFPISHCKCKILEDEGIPIYEHDLFEFI